MNIGFDNDKYVRLQSEKIQERIGQFGDKLYLEFGGKLYDDYHASRVLPGFAPDSKLRMLLQLKEQAEVVIAICADDMEKNKVREDLGITYDSEVLRLIQVFQDLGLLVGSVVITRYTGQKAADRFRRKLSEAGIPTYLHYPIEGYPTNLPLIVSEEGYGKNDYIQTSRPLVIVTAPGPGSGKMAVCLSQLYQEHTRGIQAGYAKFETFPVWNLPLKHPVNLAYEAATADLNDVNMIDPFHLESYGETTVNYNRDVEIFPVMNAIFERIYGSSPYKSPTDMGVNMAGFCIMDNDACSEASRQEIIRRYCQAQVDVLTGKAEPSEVYKIDLLMEQAKVVPSDRAVLLAANDRAKQLDCPCAALELADGSLITGKTTDLLGALSAVLLNALKQLAGIEDDVMLISPHAIEPIQELKTRYLGSHNPRLHPEEVLIALSISAASDATAKLALDQIPKLAGCQAHVSVRPSSSDRATMKTLGIVLTCEPLR